MRWLDELPLSFIILIAVMMALAPFHPEPHLLEKSRMLVNGSLTKPLDIFDLLFHSAPIGLLLLKLARIAQKVERDE